MNSKQIIIGIGIVGSIGLANYIGKNIGYKQGYAQGFGDTKTEIRQYAVNLKQKIYLKEKEATFVWWNSQDTTKIFTYGDEYGFEKEAFQDCYRELSTLIDINIDRLTKKELIKTVEFNKIYNK